MKHIAVIGSGVMGSGIAALAANAGYEVTLLDIVPKDSGSDHASRSALAMGAVKKQLAASPSGFVHPSAAERVHAGNLEDDVERLKTADWIIEVVIEKREIKHKIYELIEAHRKDGSVVSSNTSTLPLHILTDGMTERFARDFMITHFFNPPRHMRLLEVVKGPATRAESFKAMCQFARDNLGKDVVYCHDTPGFIGNRIGVFWMSAGLMKALELQIPVEVADAVLGPIAGFPKTAIFGLYDLIGIDLMRLIAESLGQDLPANDRFRTLYHEPPLLAKLIEGGYTGRKGKGGFTRMQTVDGKKIKEVLNLATGEYRTEVSVSELHCLKAAKLAKGKALKTLISGDDDASRYVWAVLSETFVYAASLIPEIADDIDSVDRAMRYGYGWSKGPFEMMDAIGVDYIVERLKNEGMHVPPLLEHAVGYGFYKMDNHARSQLMPSGSYAKIAEPYTKITLSESTDTRPLLLDHSRLKLHDLGENIACLELTSKMHALDAESLNGILRALEVTEEKAKALVIGHDDDVFSAGANLSFFLEKARDGDFAEISRTIRHGQDVMMALKTAPFPSVAAVAGIALGGGCELMMHCSAIVPHMESYPGLVEVNVGLIPGWGGCKEMLIRLGDPAKAFALVLSAKTATSAEDARQLGLIPKDTRILMHRGQLLASAKAHALSLIPNYAPYEEKMVSIPAGSRAACEQALSQMDAARPLTPHTKFIANALLDVFGAEQTNLSQRDILEREHDVFMRLIKEPATLARIEHILATGKPLAN